MLGRISILPSPTPLHGSEGKSHREAADLEQRRERRDDILREEERVKVKQGISDREKEGRVRRHGDGIQTKRWERNSDGFLRFVTINVFDKCL